MGGVRVTHGATPRPVNDDDIERIAALAAQKVIAELRAEFAQLTTLHAETRRRIEALEAKMGFPEAFAAAYFKDHAAGRPATHRPRLNAPRPIAIDRACAADPSDGDQRVDLPEYGRTLYVTPGSNPKQVWEGFLQAVGGDDEGRDPRRASGY